MPVIRDCGDALWRGRGTFCRPRRYFGASGGIAVAEQLNIGTLRFQLKATRPSEAARGSFHPALVPIEPERGGRLRGSPLSASSSASSPLPTTPGLVFRGGMSSSGRRFRPPTACVLTSR